MVATTRPQGYADEFAGLHLEQRYLVPLSREDALGFAQRLVDVRFADQPERRQKVLDRLEQAAREEATARLLQSPLQVTLMATLVDRIGRAPSERWSLFRDYYRVIYEREMERPGEASELLRTHRGHIDRIHSRVGLLLQVESERSGGAEALISRRRLEEVVDAALAEDDIEMERRERLTRTILSAAFDRLVFLVSPQQDKFGFEIRSLQEFMAAWELTHKGETVVEARLEQIAGASSFRNVFLFAASKAFTELSDLRDAITDRICPRLNESPEDELARATLAGSMLALEILEEGSVTLLALIDRGVEWARGMGDASWPVSAQEQQEIVSVVNGTWVVGNWLAVRMARELSQFPPSFVGECAFDAASPEDPSIQKPEVAALRAVSHAYRWPRRTSGDLRIGNDTLPLSVDFAPLGPRTMPAT